MGNLARVFDEQTMKECQYLMEKRIVILERQRTEFNRLCHKGKVAAQTPTPTCIQVAAQTPMTQVQQQQQQSSWLRTCPACQSPRPSNPYLPMGPLHDGSPAPPNGEYIQLWRKHARDLNQKKERSLEPVTVGY